jgi:hypothetical protein
VGTQTSTSGSRARSDDEILGIDLGVRERTVSDSGLQRSNARTHDQPDGWLVGKASVEDVAETGLPHTPGEMNTTDGKPKPDPEDVKSADGATAYRAIFNANPELREAWDTARAYRNIFPDLQQAYMLHQIFPTPVEAQRAASQAAELERIDSLFLSNRPEAMAELAATIYRLSPQSFEGLARIMSRMVGPGAPRAITSLRQEGRGENGKGKREETGLERPKHDESKVLNKAESEERLPSDEASTPLDASNAITAFLQAANGIAVERVIDAIGSQVDRLLSNDITTRARDRVIGEVYRELDSHLRSNRDLTNQLRSALRSGKFDGDHQEAIAGLLVSRACQALPSVAKKVIGEWTSSLVAASKERLARQKAGERRVDIANAGPASNQIRRPLSPSDIDYGRLSDADILNL